MCGVKIEMRGKSQPGSKWRKSSKATNRCKGSAKVALGALSPPSRWNWSPRRVKVWERSQDLAHFDDKINENSRKGVKGKNTNRQQNYESVKIHRPRFKKSGLLSSLCVLVVILWKIDFTLLCRCNHKLTAFKLKHIKNTNTSLSLTSLKYLNYLMWIKSTLGVIQFLLSSFQ